MFSVFLINLVFDISPDGALRGLQLLIIFLARGCSFREIRAI